MDAIAYLQLRESASTTTSALFAVYASNRLANPFPATCSDELFFFFGNLIDASPGSHCLPVVPTAHTMIVKKRTNGNKHELVP